MRGWLLLAMGLVGALEVCGEVAAEPIAIGNAGFKQTLRLPDYADVSGITWKGGSSFYVVRDGGNTSSNCCSIHTMVISLTADGGMYSSPLMSPGVALVGACDAEGIAYDPGSGKVWISDEAGARIREYDPASGLPTGRTVPVPPFVVNGVRGNLSLEALTISGDGLTLWTANEEALLCDGAPARPGASTVVRLMRFVRRELSADWEGAGMWAYRCDPVEKLEPVCSGVSELCALPDGSLLVLERECSYTTLGRTRIYRPDFTGATDISGLAALTNSVYVAVTKGAALYEAMDGRNFGDGFLRSQVACYEGLCLGPSNEDGSVNLMMVSDGGASRDKKKLFMTVSVETKPFVRSLKLTGFDACVLAAGRRANRMGLPPPDGQFQELSATTCERMWRLGAGGFGRGRIRMGMDGFGAERTSVYGAEVDLQYGLVKYGPYDLWLGLGGSYCPQQGDALGLGADAERGRMELGYGEVRLLAVPQRRVTEELALGLRFGVAFNWLDTMSAAGGRAGDFSDSDMKFATQGILGVQATWLFTDRLGLYSNFDWRLGGETEFSTPRGESSVDMSGWFCGVGAFVTF